MHAYITYPHKLDECIVDPSAMRKEEATSRTQIIEEE